MPNDMIYSRQITRSTPYAAQRYTTIFRTIRYKTLTPGVNQASWTIEVTYVYRCSSATLAVAVVTCSFPTLKNMRVSPERPPSQYQVQSRRFGDQWIVGKRAIHIEAHMAIRGISFKNSMINEARAKDRPVEY